MRPKFRKSYAFQYTMDTKKTSKKQETLDRLLYDVVQPTQAERPPSYLADRTMHRLKSVKIAPAQKPQPALGPAFKRVMWACIAAVHGLVFWQTFAEATSSVNWGAPVQRWLVEPLQGLLAVFTLELLWVLYLVGGAIWLLLLGERYLAKKRILFRSSTQTGNSYKGNSLSDKN